MLCCAGNQIPEDDEKATPATGQNPMLPLPNLAHFHSPGSERHIMGRFLPSYPGPGNGEPLTAGAFGAEQGLALMPEMEPLPQGKLWGLGL